MAGWVFADLLLVLFIVGLGTAIPVDPPEPPPPAPVVEPEPEIIGMETDPVKVDLAFDADALQSGNQRAVRSIRTQIRRKTTSLAAGGQTSALVLIFGGGETAGIGQRVAESVYPQLGPATRNVFPKETPSRFFWDGGLPYGGVRLEIFLFTTEDSAGAP